MIDFPKSFKKMIGTEQIYSLNKKVKCKGIITELRWSTATIMNLKTRKEFLGIEIKIKPSTGRRSIWSRAFNSGIKVSKP
jgi:DNA/RNA endonuclease YhcR with UshA esterase domain